METRRLSQKATMDAFDVTPEIIGLAPITRMSRLLSRFGLGRRFLRWRYTIHR